jgi:hypothetical protein
VQLLTEYQDDRIGVGMQVVKANDMKRPPLGSLGYEFDAYGVSRIWRPTSADFPELLTVKTTSGGLAEEVRLFLLGNGEAWADDIARAINHSRGSVAKILAASPAFQVIRKEGHKLYYGVAETSETQAPMIVSAPL